MLELDALEVFHETGKRCDRRLRRLGEEEVTESIADGGGRHGGIREDGIGQG